MSAEERPPRLSAMLEQLAQEDLPQVLREARAQARAQVRELLADALRDALMARLAEEPGMARLAEEPGTARLAEGSAAVDRTATPPAARYGEDGRGVYVYGVVAAGERLPEDLEAIAAEHPPRLLVDGGLAAVISEVPLAQFGEESLREHLQDLAWVERTARAHESLLEAIGQRTALIPMRMCTIYRSQDGVLEMLAREGGALSEALSALSGKSEWGVKLLLASSTAPAAAPAEDPPRSGSDYLRRRQLERDEREQRSQLLDQACAEIHLRLSAASCQSQVLAPQVAARGETMVLNGVYLVENERLDEFLREVEAAREEGARRGLELVRTGPWPAYNFVPGTIGAAW
jgi:hypothetical protein